MTTHLELTWRSSPDADDIPSSGDPLADVLPLPIDVSLQQFILRDAEIDLDGQVQQIPSLQFSASLRDKLLQVQDLRLEAAPIQLGGSAQIELVPAYPGTRIWRGVTPRLWRKASTAPTAAL